MLPPSSDFTSGWPTPPLSVLELRHALAVGRRRFPGLNLRDQDAGQIDLSDCCLRGGRFQESRFGHARLARADVRRAHFQRALLWGADLSGLQAHGSFWQEADLSGSRLQQADFSGALLHRACLQGVVAPDSHWQGARLVPLPSWLE